MKPKIILAVITFGLAVLLLTACGTNAVDGTAQPSTSMPTAAPVIPTPTPTVTPTAPTPSMSPTVTPAASSPDSTPDLESGPDGIVYTNQTLGFQMTFPKDWDGYFKIVENNWGIAVNFYGKSKTGTILEEDMGREGLQFFVITNYIDPMNEEPTLDSIQKIGTAKNVDYYYAHPGLSYDLGALYDIITVPDPESYVPYTVNQTELDLAAQDWAKTEQMDSEIQSVLATFKAI